MGNRSRVYDKPKEVLTDIEKAQRKEKLLKESQRRRVETESTHDGRPSVESQPGSNLKGYDKLMEALIKEHPEKDPAKIK